VSAEKEIQLEEPVTFGNHEYNFVVLREARTGDVLEAQEASEKVVMTAEGPQLASSPARMGNEMLARQVARLEGEQGTVQGPIQVDELKRFGVRDFNALMYESERLEGAADAQHADKQATERGRDEGVDPAD